MSEPAPFAYVGSELDVFAGAKNWRAYWSSLVRPHLGTNVLEIGAGIGSVTEALRSPDMHWTAVEPDPGLACRIASDDPARSAAHLTVITGSIADVPEDSTFDSILYIDVLEHIEDDAVEVNRAWAHLAKGGRLVILSPAHQWLFTPFDAAIGHYRRYSLKGLDRLRPTAARVIVRGYLDAAGVLASSANRVLLRSAHPTRAQIDLWDKRLVPTSRLLDRLLGHRIGKSVLAIWQKP